MKASWKSAARAAALGTSLFTTLHTSYAQPAQPAPGPTSEPVPPFPQASIKNAELEAHYYLPDKQKGYYRGTRFDWSGLVSRVTCRGHSFFSEFKQEHDPLNHDDICGTAEEFGMTQPPPGFAQARPGGSFVKIGVGVLERGADSDYGFAKKYRLLDAGDWRATGSADRVEFTHSIQTADGWGYTYTKTLSLPPGRRVMKIDRLLKNIGTHAFSTDHYGHNFLRLDNVPAGPAYVLEFPFAPRFGEGASPEGCVQTSLNSLVFLKEVPKGRAVWVPLEGFTRAGGNQIRIVNRKSGSALSLATDLPLVRLVLYSSNGVLCPEPFVKFSLEPGETKSWNTIYEFEVRR